VEDEQRKRLRWVQLYEQFLDAGRVCLKCGISRPTLRKWVRRYQSLGVDGLRSCSRRPKNSPALKRTEAIIKLVLELRRARRMGARRLHSELRRHHDIKLSLSTLHAILNRHDVRPLQRPFPHRKVIVRYNRPVPGDRVQMDTCKIAPGLYQYTAIDDCSRFRVLGAYPRRTAANTLEFLDRVIEEMPFPIQRIQTDRGREFFAEKVQKRFMQLAIKFRPIKPRSPHLNGKVERSQKTDLYEFWCTADFKSSTLGDALEEWQMYYNWHRPHGSLHGKAPIDRVCELLDHTPLSENVADEYDPKKGVYLICQPRRRPLRCLWLKVQRKPPTFR